MYDLYTIIENAVVFLSRDVVFKIILPLVLIALIFDVIRYMFAKDSKREDIIDALKAKGLGIFLLAALPFLILWFMSFVAKITGIESNMDTSVLDKLIGSSKASDSAKNDVKAP